MELKNKNLWHDAKEEPVKDIYVLVEFVPRYYPKEIRYLVAINPDVNFEPSWNDKATKWQFKRWLYIKDL